IRSGELQLTVLQKENSDEQPWASYLAGVQKALQQTQEGAVARYTEQYGPLTSVIQRRLRSVSGFEDVLLRPEGGGIDVRVTRSGELLPPTDFFSQSQQQILILSLFLTAY